MRVLEELQEDVFRFRMQHRYDYRFMFLLFDLLWNIAKISLFIGLVYALWLAGSKVLEKLEITTNATPVVYPVSDEQTQIAAGDVIEVKEPETNPSDVELDLGNQSGGSESVAESLTDPLPESEPAALAALPEVTPTIQTELLVGTLPSPVTDADDEAVAVVTEIPALARPPINRDAVVLDDAWIRDQPGSKFTIQIGSTPNLMFLRRLGLLLPGDHDRAVYHYKNTADGTPEYGLAWGVFDSVAAAQLELAGLDDYSKRYGPWIRRVQGIQRQMDNR
jgi:septal ring-binding cell division protein DamX